MKINNEQALKNMKGEDLKVENEVLTVGKAISNILLASEEKGKMKLFILAKKFYDDSSIDLDSADFALVKNEIAKTRIYNTLVSGQLEVILEGIKDEKGTKGK